MNNCVFVFAVLDTFYIKVDQVQDLPIKAEIVRFCCIIADCEFINALLLFLLHLNEDKLFKLKGKKLSGIRSSHSFVQQQLIYFLNNEYEIA